MTSKMPLITCYAKLSFHLSDLRSFLPLRDTNGLSKNITKLFSEPKLSSEQRIVI